MRTNDYDSVYSNDPVGFVFSCNKGNLGQPVALSKKEISAIPASAGNSDSIYIRCKNCDTYMTFITGPADMLDGKWVCPTCGRSVREETPYNRLDKINREFERKLFDDDF